jgi:hypothetical protein
MLIMSLIVGETGPSYHEPESTGVESETQNVVTEPESIRFDLGNFSKQDLDNLTYVAAEFRRQISQTREIIDMSKASRQHRQHGFQRTH